MNTVMITKAYKFAIAYVLFFWSIAWRTFALSIATAILTAFGLAGLTVIRFICCLRTHVKVQKLNKLDKVEYTLFRNAPSRADLYFR